ncbi:MAG: glycoside hydrolase family 3 C-terminal domain-containing protein [Bryobacteraceae bacterium]|jgi:beta-glucosidase
MRKLWLAALPMAAGITILALSVSGQGQTAPPAQAPSPAQAPGGGRGRGAAAVTHPWSDTALSPDQRADLVVAQMTLDEKIHMLHGTAGEPRIINGRETNDGAGWIPGIPRLGMPDLNMADSAVGVAGGHEGSRYSTLLPSSLGAAANWNPDLALLYGQIVGRELRDQGYDVSIGGGVDLAREPRNGRSFEYAGEDPILAGVTVGTLEKGVQSQQVMGDLKHYALNDQETGRNTANAILDKRSMRETDLLAYQIAYKISDAAVFMCGFNLVNGDWACENDYLLNQVLKKDFGFKGFIVSDWGGTHSMKKAIMAGLDMEQPTSDYFGDTLEQAVQTGEIPLARIDDAVHRILRGMFANGLWDNPVTPTQQQVVDVFKHLDEAQKIEEESIVLLKNAANQLPLNAATIQSIAVIGSHSDVGVPSGGGSAQVHPPGGNAAQASGGRGGRGPMYFPSSPMKFIQAKAPKAKVEYNEGTDPAAAAALAKGSQVAIVFVNQPMSEGRDVPSLSLPGDQDALVDAVAAANPHTIVVAETGSAVSMPWEGKVSAILEAWFPGIGGGQAMANVLFGEVNPSGKLPITFAKSDADLPHPEIARPPEQAGGRGGRGGGRAALPPEEMQAAELNQARQLIENALLQATQASQPLQQAQQHLAQAAASGGKAPVAEAEAAAQALHAALVALQAAEPAPVAAGGRGGQPFDVPYTEKLLVGYKWFDAQNKEPLFPFGLGLSYTTYAYSDLKATASGHNVSVSFQVKNTGKRAGKETAQVYVTLPASTNEPPKRLIGWQKIELAPGETKAVNLTIDPLYVSIFDEASDGWRIAPGDYKIWAGPSSRDLPLSQTVSLQ